MKQRKVKMNKKGWLSSLSSGEFVGLVADNPDQKIAQKMFFSEIVNDHAAIRKEESNYLEIPQFRLVGQSDVFSNFLQIKSDVSMIIQNELERMMDTPGLGDLLIRKL